MGQICAEATDVRTWLGFGNEGTSLAIRTLSRTSDDSEFAILEDLNSSDSNLSRMTQHLWTPGAPSNWFDSPQKRYRTQGDRRDILNRI
jgi:hypothetical protein